MQNYVIVLFMINVTFILQRSCHVEEIIEKYYPFLVLAVLNFMKMDKTAVKNVVNKYLDCVKLLLCETMPDDLPELLDDLIHDTTVLSAEIKSHRLNESGEKFNLNTQGRYNLPSNTKLVYELKPVVLLKRLQIDDKNLLKDVENKFKKEKSEKISKSPKSRLIKTRSIPYETQEKMTPRTSRKRNKSECETINPKQYHTKIQRYPCESMTDGCCIH